MQRIVSESFVYGCPRRILKLMLRTWAVNLKRAYRRLQGQCVGTRQQKFVALPTLSTGP